MKKNSYGIAFEEWNIDSFVERYHFAQTDKDLLNAMARIVFETMKVYTAYEKKGNGIVGIATLGKEYDALEDVMLMAEQLTLSYSMECLSMELLSKGYERLNESVHQELGQWLSTFHFLDDQEMEQLSQRESLMDAVGVDGTGSMMKPLKSVMFQADLVPVRQESGCHDCSNCSNKTCSFRQIMEEKKQRYQGVEQKKEQAMVYSYGVSMIFGGENK